MCYNAMSHECIRLSFILELSLTERRMLLKTKEQENGGWFTPNKIVTSEESFTLIHITDVYLLCCLFNCLQTTADDHNYSDSECEVWRQLPLPSPGPLQTAGEGLPVPGRAGSRSNGQSTFYCSRLHTTLPHSFLLLLPLTFVFRGRPEQCKRFVLLLLLLLSAVELQTRVRKDFTITEKAPTRPLLAFTFKTLLRHYAKRALTPR